MGEVYAAVDTRLDRAVAIKVLPEHLAGDPKLRERFEREARAVSSLNHPHICTLFDVGEQDGIHYLVMELVEGDTLAARLEKGRLPLDEALEYAIQIADALDKAHRQGVVHRDLKPGNIMITKSGTKLLDFGLAKLKSDATEASPLSVMSTQDAPPPLTAEGTILGTLQYMAPEQLEGKEADARTDIFAFGAVVYEMVTGKKAFEGESQASLIGAILKDTPQPVTEVQPVSPAMLDHVIRACLAKSPEDRCQTATDLMRELKWVSHTELAGPIERSRPVSWAKMVPVVLGVLIVGVLIGAIAFRNPASSPQLGVTRFLLEVTEGSRLSGEAFQRPARQNVALSPDGTHLVYAATDGERSQLYLRPMDQDQAIPMSGTEGASSPFFSPDGESIGFFVGDMGEEGELMRVSTQGGDPRTISVSVPGFNNAWASWTSDNNILLSYEDGLYQVSDNGGSPNQLTRVDPSQSGSFHLYPEMLPGGGAILFNVWDGEIPSEWNIVAQSLETGEQHLLVEGGSDPRYVQSGHIVFARTGTLMAVPFDVRRLEVTGDPVVVLEDVMHTERGGNSYRRMGDGQFAVSRSGTLAYAPGGVYPVGQNVLVWVDRDGEVDPLPGPPASTAFQRVSPDGTRLVYSQGPEGERQIWVYDIELELPLQLTFQGTNAIPIWSPDGARVAFASDGGDGGPLNLFSMAADGSGDPKRLTESDRIQLPSSWSRDGVLAFTHHVEGSQWDIMTLSTDGASEPEPFLDAPFSQEYPAFSPDGRWLAYSSYETGRQEVYVRPFPAGEPVYPV